jgi:hypothetical protein
MTESPRFSIPNKSRSQTEFCEIGIEKHWFLCGQPPPSQSREGSRSTNLVGRYNNVCPRVVEKFPSPDCQPKQKGQTSQRHPALSWLTCKGGCGRHKRNGYTPSEASCLAPQLGFRSDFKSDLKLLIAASVTNSLCTVIVRKRDEGTMRMVREYSTNVLKCDMALAPIQCEKVLHGGLTIGWFRGLCVFQCRMGRRD